MEGRGCAQSKDSRVFAEIETLRGFKIRFFEATPESLKVLAAVCGEALQ